MRIGITKVRKPVNIIQSSSLKYKKGFNRSSLASYIGGIWGIVTKQNSEDVTVDVKMRNGVELRHIKVRSLEWSGYNSNRAFGERDIPPLDSKVFIMLPDGPDNLDTGFVFCSVIDTVWEVGEEAEKELAVSGKNREYLHILEIGWEIKYDKDTGDVTITTPNGDIIKVDIQNEELQVTDKHANDIKLDANGIILQDINGNVTTLDSSGIVLTDTNGNNVSMVAGKVTVNGNLEVLQ